MMNYVYRHAGTTRPLDGVGIVSTLRSDVPSSHDALATHEYRQSPCCVLVCNLKSPLYLGTGSRLEVLGGGLWVSELLIWYGQQKRKIWIVTFGKRQ